MQMSFFDFEEFNELKAEAKKKEAPGRSEAVSGRAGPILCNL